MFASTDSSSTTSLSDLEEFETLFYGCGNTEDEELSPPPPVRLEMYVVYPIRRPIYQDENAEKTATAERLLKDNEAQIKRALLRLKRAATRTFCKKRVFGQGWKLPSDNRLLDAYEIMLRRLHEDVIPLKFFFALSDSERYDLIHRFYLRSVFKLIAFDNDVVHEAMLNVYREAYLSIYCKGKFKRVTEQAILFIAVSLESWFNSAKTTCPVGYWRDPEHKSLYYDFRENEFLERTPDGMKAIVGAYENVKIQSRRTDGNVLAAGETDYQAAYRLSYLVIFGKNCNDGVNLTGKAFDFSSVQPYIADLHWLDISG